MAQPSREQEPLSPEGSQEELQELLISQRTVLAVRRGRLLQVSELQVVRLSKLSRQVLQPAMPVDKMQPLDFSIAVQVATQQPTQPNRQPSQAFGETSAFRPT